MSKKALTLQEQIVHVKASKKILFSSSNEEKFAEKFFAKYNYLNIISLKYLFATGLENNNNLYGLDTKYIDIERQYLELLKLETFIRESVLDYETELKVHLTMFFINYLEANEINFEEFLDRLHFYNFETQNIEKIKSEFKSKISKEWERHIEDFSGHADWNTNYYLLIKILNFGTITTLLGFLCKNGENYTNVYNLLEVFIKKTSNFILPKNLESIITINILRNAVSHKESLIIYLNKGYRKNLLKSRKKSIEFIYNYSTGKNIDKNCWIMQFENYRLQNRKKRPFNEIKIMP